MKKIAITEILDDMVLAKAVLGLDGKVLLQPGSKLRKNMVGRLQSWGVQSAYVEDGEVGSDAKDDVSAVEKRLTRLEQVFDGLQEQANMHVIYEAVKTHLNGMVHGSR